MRVAGVEPAVRRWKRRVLAVTPHPLENIMIQTNLMLVRIMFLFHDNVARHKNIESTLIEDEPSLRTFLFEKFK